jgi:hypothetical protein
MRWYEGRTKLCNSTEPNRQCTKIAKMFVTECKTEFLGHQIVAHNSWGPTFSMKSVTGENRLYIDGKVVDTNKDVLAFSNAPIMRGCVTDDNGKIHVVEVFARSGLVRVKLRIHIDGEKVAGEDFEPLSLARLNLGTLSNRMSRAVAAVRGA